MTKADEASVGRYIPMWTQKDVECETGLFPQGSQWRSFLAGLCICDV